MTSTESPQDISSRDTPANRAPTTEPVGYSEAMPLFDQYADLHCTAQTRLPLSISRLNRVLLITFGLLLLALLFLPWQQFVRGQGKVTALNPLERSVLVEAPLPGRVETVNIVEGQEVRKGDVLIRLVDNDPLLISNLQNQQADLEQRMEAAHEKHDRMKNRVIQLEESLPEAIRIATQQVEAARFAEETAELQFGRMKSLYEDPRGLASEREWELARLRRNSTRAEHLKAQSALMKTKLDLNASIESAYAAVESARSDLAKATQDFRAIKIKINQTGRQTVSAPRDGIIYRLRATEGTFLKEGSPLCTIIPKTTEYVAELWIDGNDMPLLQERETDSEGNTISPGSPVRLQFEGWPAIQFVGWPSVAVGTFGGEVIFVDAIDNGQGMFRILVAARPDEIKNENGEPQTVPWPDAPIMRQGIQVQGWVLLKRVPLWYEVWRQINGFPPTVDRESPMGKQLKR